MDCTALRHPVINLCLEPLPGVGEAWEPQQPQLQGRGAFCQTCIPHSNQPPPVQQKHFPELWEAKSIKCKTMVQERLSQFPRRQPPRLQISTSLRESWTANPKSPGNSVLLDFVNHSFLQFQVGLHCASVAYGLATL